MAVTQQLARVTGEYLEACRRAAAASVDADPGWNPPAVDRPDLNRAPAMLSHAAAAGTAPALRQALDRSCGGDPVPDVSYLDHPEAVGLFGPPPTALFGHRFDRDICPYLTSHFEALRAFYDEAADRGLHVVLWWD